MMRPCRVYTRQGVGGAGAVALMQEGGGNGVGVGGGGGLPLVFGRVGLWWLGVSR